MIRSRTSTRRFRMPIVGVLAVAILLSSPVDARAEDTDGDGQDDAIDNCVGVYNPSQRDPLKLSGTTLVTAPSMEDIDIALSNDGTRVVYAVGSQPRGVYSVPVNGSAAPIALTFYTAELDGWVMSPDRTRIAYYWRGPNCPNGEGCLYSTRTDGRGPRILLSSATHRSPSQTTFTADGSSVVFRNSVGDLGWYIVPVDGPAAAVRQLLGPGEVSGKAFPSPDNLYFAFHTETATPYAPLFSRRIDGTPPTADLAPHAWFYGFSGSGSRVLYSSGSNVESRATDGSGSIFALAPSFSKFDYLLSPEDIVVYESDSLYSVPIDGSTVAQDLMPPGLSESKWSLSSDGQHVVFFDGGPAIYSVPIDATLLPLQLDEVTEPTAFLGFPYRPVMGGDRAVYIRYHDSTRILRSVPVDGSEAAIDLSDTVAADLGILLVQADEDSDLVGYEVRQDDLYPTSSTGYVVPIDRSFEPSSFTGNIPEGAHVYDYRFGPDGDFVIFTADRQFENLDVYVSWLDVDGDLILDACDLCDREYDPLNLDEDGDGVCAADNCPWSANPDQGPATFGQPVVAPSSTRFEWTSDATVNWVRGPLDLVSSYTTELADTVEGIGVDDATTPPANVGFYYVFRFGGACTASSWQTEIGLQPGRDLTLP